jgi:hypothetical protein
MKRGVAILALALALALAVTGTRADELDGLMALLAQRQHGVADFVEEKTLSVLKQPLKSSGLLIYDAPDHLEQRTLQPRPQSMVLDHGVLTMHIGGRSRTVRLVDFPQLAPLIDSIRATLAGDRAALERVFIVDFDGTPAQWQLQLTPRDPQLATTLTHIEMRGERDAVREVQVQQHDGDRSVMHITPHE